MQSPSPTSDDVPSYGTQWHRLKPFEQLLIDDPVEMGAYIMAGILCFRPEHIVSVDWVKHVVAARLLDHPRFRSLLVIPKNRRASFVPLPTPVDLDRHVFTELPPDDQEHPLSKTERTAAFQARINELLAQDLPLDRPLWSIHIFPGYAIDTPSNRGTSLLLRVHHVIADGVALVKFFALRMADTALVDHHASLPVPQRQLLSERAHRRHQQHVITPNSNTRPPKSALDTLKTLARLPREFLSIFVGTAFPEPPNVLNSIDSQPPPPEHDFVRKRFLHCVPPSTLPFDFVRAAAKRLHASINDLLLTAATGAIRRYALRFSSERPLPSKMRVAITVNRHSIATPTVEVNNFVVLIPVKIPLLEEDPRTRLQHVHAVMTKLKAGRKPAFAAMALLLLAKSPLFIRAPLFSHYGRSASAFSTNVPGPSSRISMGGVEVDSISILGPIGDHHASLILTFFTYGENCSLCVGGNPEILLHHRLFVDLVTQEMLDICHLDAQSSDIDKSL